MEVLELSKMLVKLFKMGKNVWGFIYSFSNYFFLIFPTHSGVVNLPLMAAQRASFNRIDEG